MPLQVLAALAALAATRAPEARWIAELRLLLPPILAAGTAAFVDQMCARRGFLPPGFARPVRRFLGFLAVALFFWIALYGNLAALGRDLPEPDLAHLSPGRLFLVHFLMLGTLVVWFLAGYAGKAAAPAGSPAPAAPPPPEADPAGELVTLEPMEETLAFPAPAPALAPSPPSREPLGRVLAAQLGLLAPDVPRELGLGLLVGVGSWFAVVVAAILLGLLLYAVGADKMAPKEPPELILWIAALPIGIRFLASLSAGVVEETFFRGFLQPRIGLWLSTALFVLGHLSYGQPLLLFGVAILSLIYGFLVRWRQTIWPAIAAHALFDGVQLLVVIPTALKFLGKS
jgi:membrane protease YdiL (CAAX protease family)